jgi:hypothetical protein
MVVFNVEDDKIWGDEAMMPTILDRAISRWSSALWRLLAAVLTAAHAAGAAGPRPREAEAALTKYCNRLMHIMFVFARLASYERTVTGDLEQADEHSQMLADASAEFSQNCTQ